MTDIQPTRETGATNLEIFRIREKNISSGYRGGVKIDLDFTFIAQCKRSMFPFVVFVLMASYILILMQMWNWFRSFLTLFVCIPLL